jgi:hypothetical protein
MVARGIRNNNPTNIRKGSDWKGLAEVQSDPAFCVFKHPKWGIRAFCVLMENYDKNYGINTVRGIVSRFAPDFENDTTSYMEHICSQMCVKRDEKLDLQNHLIMLKLCKAIIKHECGCVPYTDNEIMVGVELALGKQPAKEEI